MFLMLFFATEVADVGSCRFKHSISILLVCVNHLQQDGASRDAELDAVLGSIVPGEELQVLYGAVGQSRLHVTGGLQAGQKEDNSVSLHVVYSTRCLLEQSQSRNKAFIFPASQLERQKETSPNPSRPEQTNLQVL